MVWSHGVTVLFYVLVSLETKIYRTFFVPACTNGLWRDEPASSSSVSSASRISTPSETPPPSLRQHSLGEVVLLVTCVGAVFDPHAGHVFAGPGGDVRGMAGQLFRHIVTRLGLGDLF